MKPPGVTIGRLLAAVGLVGLNCAGLRWLAEARWFEDTGLEGVGVSSLALQAGLLAARFGRGRLRRFGLATSAALLGLAAARWAWLGLSPDSYWPAHGRCDDAGFGGFLAILTRCPASTLRWVVRNERLLIPMVSDLILGLPQVVGALACGLIAASFWGRPKRAPAGLGRERCSEPA